MLTGNPNHGPSLLDAGETAPTIGVHGRWASRPVHLSRPQTARTNSIKATDANADQRDTTVQEKLLPPGTARPRSCGNGIRLNDDANGAGKALSPTSIGRSVQRVTRVQDISLPSANTEAPQTAAQTPGEGTNLTNAREAAHIDTALEDPRGVIRNLNAAQGETLPPKELPP